MKSEQISIEVVPVAKDKHDLATVAYSDLSGIFTKHFHAAMSEAGNYLLENFYGGDIENARNNKPVQDDSLLQLHSLLSANSDDSPSRSWLYNALRLVVDAHDLADFHTYGNIGLSHKVKLLTVSDLEQKKSLVQAIVDDNLSVRDLGDRIKEIKQLEGQGRRKSLKQLISKPDMLFSEDNSGAYDLQALKGLKPKMRSGIKNDAKVQLKSLITDNATKFSQVDGYQTIVNTIDTLEKLEKDKSDGVEKKEKTITGTEEWASNTFNISTGCLNNCRYCYAKWDAVKRFKRVEGGKWSKPVIRQKDVLKGHPKYSGTVMCPSTHDIYPDNVYAYMIALDNLLRAGNKVLIVSKPWKSCIDAICTHFKLYRSQILFRFTIGACDNDVLSYWEPDAPSYEERRSALQLAFNMGFETSVSCEPMLDSANINTLVDDLLPFVTDAIWIGKMNKIKSRVMIEDDTVKDAIQHIEAGQTDEIIKVIHARWKDNPNVKWKDSIKDVVGAIKPTEAGLDI